jgi:hypothetical protein
VVEAAHRHRAGDGLGPQIRQRLDPKFQYEDGARFMFPEAEVKAARKG